MRALVVLTFLGSTIGQRFISHWSSTMKRRAVECVEGGGYETIFDL